MGVVPRCVVAASLMSVVFAARADEPPVWGVGVGVISTQKPYQNSDRQYTPIPILHYENRYFRFSGTAAEVKLPALHLSETQQLNIGLIARYDGAGYSSDDADILKGMDKRKGGFWGGAGIGWQNPVVDLFTDWTHDLSGNSRGQRLRLGAEKRWHLSEQFTLTPRLVVSRYNSSYVDYYYGVRRSEARPWRPAYRADASINTEMGVRSLYTFNEHHTLMVDVEMTLLASEIKDSPLVNRTNENRILISYLYYF
ncbi:MipA/OmpV family protein [Kosakonia sacchari]|uniref:MipA/OmpV family protein n=1 Tax=Kosakonia sacchari TaxID=1158459 RepID=UPI000BE6097F|nr:MipA/OmpV family protein [Kosakonia sacchari]PDO81873.1 structural protein MipA [Kosakonia sacchari]